MNSFFLQYAGRLAGLMFAGSLAIGGILVMFGCTHQEKAGSPQPEASANCASSGDTQGRSVLCDTGGEADNSACLACHMDFEAEELAVQHLEADITCAACHGFSGAHRGDELNIITPDVLYGRSRIEPFCKACHPQHTTSDAYKAFVKEWSGRRRPNGRMVLPDSVCTDCHGNHAILAPEHQIAE